MCSRIRLIFSVSCLAFACASSVACGQEESEFRVLSSSPKLLREYVERGNDPNAALKGGLSLLNFSVYARSTECVEMLIDAGASPNRTSPNIDPIIITAFAQTPADLLELLLAKGADPNAQDDGGNTVLHLLATGHHTTRVFGMDSNQPETLQEGKRLIVEKYAVKEVEMVELLVKYGANLKVKNKDGLTPMQVAIRTGPTRLIDVFEKAQLTYEKKQRAREEAKELEQEKGEQEKSVRTRIRCQEPKTKLTR